MQTAWLLLGLAVERPWLAISGPFFTLPSHDGLRKHTSGLVGSPFLTMLLFLSVWTGSHWPRAVTIDNSLMSGCGLSHESAEDGCKGHLVDVLSIKMKGNVVCLSDP